jgi:hypothetical protein
MYILIHAIGDKKNNNNNNNENNIMPLKCRYCGKVCESQRGLTQHIKSTKSCSEKQRLYLLEDGVGYKTAGKYLPFTTIVVPRKRHKCSVEEGQLPQDDMGFTEEEGKPPAILGTPMYQYGSDGDEYLEESDVEFGDGGGYEEESSSEPDSVTDCNKSIKEDFQKYVDHASKSFGGFSSLEVNAISLLHMLRQSGAPLGMYEAVMGWHLDVLLPYGA